MRSDLIDLTVVVIGDPTTKAVRVDHGGEEPVWLPFSQIEIEPNEDGKTHTVTLPEWLATEKRMI